MALGAMFVQQTFASIGRTLPLVIAPAIIEDLHIDPALVGVYVGAAALAALVFQLGCGSFIIRYGALRMSQVALVFLALGMALAAVLFDFGDYRRRRCCNLHARQFASTRALFAAEAGAFGVFHQADSGAGGAFAGGAAWPPDDLVLGLEWGFAGHSRRVLPIRRDAGTIAW